MNWKRLSINTNSRVKPRKSNSLRRLNQSFQVSTTITKATLSKIGEPSGDASCLKAYYYNEMDIWEILDDS